MKISSGWSKGLKILTPEGADTRPTRERVRQAAVNMLQPWIAGARVLDLFAGSGAVGIELVSRGATGACFVESSPAALRCLRVNTDEAANRAVKQAVTLSPWSVEAGDVHQYLISAASASFDLVWADPPYELVPQFLETSRAPLIRCLADGGIFVLESGCEAQPLLDSWSGDSGLRLIKQREYGVTLITIWQKS